MYIDRTGRRKISRNGELVDPLAHSMGFGKNKKWLIEKKDRLCASVKDFLNHILKDMAPYRGNKFNACLFCFLAGGILGFGGRFTGVAKRQWCD